MAAYKNEVTECYTIQCIYGWVTYPQRIVRPGIFQTVSERDMLEQSKDHNPGTANAFMYGGVLVRSSDAAV